MNNINKSITRDAKLPVPEEKRYNNYYDIKQHCILTNTSTCYITEKKWLKDIKCVCVCVWERGREITHQHTQQSIKLLGAQCVRVRPAPNMPAYFLE